MELEFFWACSSFPGILKQYCHKPTLILSVKAQKSLDAPAKLPTGIKAHPPWPHQPCLPAVKMQSLSLADEHPQGTTRTIFSKTSIRRLCFITSLVLSHSFQLSNGKDLRGVLQAYYQNLKSQRNFTYDFRKGSLFEGFNLHLFCTLPPSSKNITVTKHENQRCSLQQRQDSLFSEKEMLDCRPCWGLFPDRCEKSICRCQ